MKIKQTSPNNICDDFDEFDEFDDDSLELSPGGPPKKPSKSEDKKESSYRRIIKQKIIGITRRIPKEVDDFLELTDNPAFLYFFRKNVKFAISLGAAKHILAKARKLQDDDTNTTYIYGLTKDLMNELAKSLGNNCFISKGDGCIIYHFKKENVTVTLWLQESLSEIHKYDHPELVNILYEFLNKSIKIAGKDKYNSIIIGPCKGMSVIESETSKTLLKWIKPFSDKKIPRVLLLQGSPGTGKSTTAHTICKKLDKRTLYIDSMSCDFGEHYTYVSLVKDYKPEVIVIDDFDRFVNHNKWMSIMESMKKHVNLIIVTTNNFDSLPPALLRPGRIDRIFFFNEAFSHKDNEFINEKFNLNEEEIKFIKSMTVAERNELKIRMETLESDFKIKEELNDLIVRKSNDR